MLKPVILYIFQLIWVCILCRKKQELIIKTGTWMQSSSTDPILKRIEDDMSDMSDSYGVPQSRPQQPPPIITTTADSSAGAHFEQYYSSSSSYSQKTQRHHPHHHHSSSSVQSGGATTPSTASSTISSLFSRALSLAGTPTAASTLLDGVSNVAGRRRPATASNTPVHTPTGSASIGFGITSRGRLERGSSLDRPSGPPPPPSMGNRPGLGGGFNNSSSNSSIISRANIIAGMGGLSRQVSLESTESVSQSMLMGGGGSSGGGRRTPSVTPTHNPSMLRRRRSEGGDIAIDPFDPAPPSSRPPSSYAQQRYYYYNNNNNSGTNRGGRYYGQHHNNQRRFPNSASFHSRPVVSPHSGAGSGIVSPYLVSSRFVQESMSAPEDAGDGGHDSAVESSASFGGGTTTGVGRKSHNLYPRVLVSDGEARDLCPPLHESVGGESAGGNNNNNASSLRRQSLLDPRTAAAAGPGGRKTVNRRKLDATFRNDSLSSDQSECVRPPPPKPHKQKRHHQQHQRRANFPISTRSMASSSEDEVRSTPDYTSCGEEEMESESVSEKGKTKVA